MTHEQAPEQAPGDPILKISDLRLSFRSAGGGSVEALRGVSFEIRKGETLALVGESGSGKSITALAAMGLQPASAERSGSIRWRGEETIDLKEKQLQRLRGSEMAMIFQEPMTALNPLHTIRRQIVESLSLHRGLRGAAATEATLKLLDEVGIPDAARRLDAYPHQLSGGQRQRVMIAMALANDPDLLIADEPTTALDVTVQAQILALLKRLQAERGMAMLFITHDLGVVRRMADRVCVMTKGEIVEQGPTEEIFLAPKHDYTRKLLGSEPRGRPSPLPEGAPLAAEAREARVWFPIHTGFFRRVTGHVKAVDGVSFDLRAGETLGVVGESGSGKSTLGFATLRLLPHEAERSGEIMVLGHDMQKLTSREIRPFRRDMQAVFQDPFGSLSPRLSVVEIIAEGLKAHGLTPDPQERRARVAEAMVEVGLDPVAMDRYPHEFSGGQRQRISIARAMALKPKLVILDEPTSALDVTVQAQIVDLLRDLQQKYGLAYMFISHDLRVVRALAHRIIVMKDGQVVEAGPAEEIFERPKTDYARALIAAALHNEAPPAVAASPAAEAS
ncbi:ABC transporter ATP-binding protein [Neomegalonema perideroedes]|uniref:ABC transporter ATP-binding protein n=1 Tax=Neomegalonema perideroedes TaxID=217219 RepID=UPI000370F833|nr:ABC transporter ATP-binding protein [Neomegalonema perideroedes]